MKNKKILARRCALLIAVSEAEKAKAVAQALKEERAKVAAKKAKKK